MLVGEVGHVLLKVQMNVGGVAEFGLTVLVVFEQIDSVLGDGSFHGINAYIRP